MDPESSTTRWRSAFAVLDALFELEPESRSARLENLRAVDPLLHGRVRRLLGRMESGDRFLESPLNQRCAELMASLSSPDGSTEDDPWLGRTLGPYRIVERLGSGGMGIVFRARRVDDEFDREVALKVAPGVLLGGELRWRFLRERQILARLEHPHVARLLDGGTTEEGLPFLVADLVDGMPIDEYCEIRGQGLAARLRLFLQVCSAVEYLHRNLIVHRDLKPSNILVDAEGQVRILDFGLAKLVGEDSAIGDGRTRQGRQPLTPASASPEQLRGERVTTTSDVFSLGLLLFRLLTDREAIPVSGLSWAEAIHRVETLDPPRPSDVVSGGRRRRLLRGDLDAIVGKALRKEPAERYPSAAELEADLSRYREGLPVTAHPPSAAYRLKKLARQYRLATAVVATFGLTLSAGVAGVLWQADVAREQRDQATLQARRAERIAETMEDLFSDADPFGQTGRNLSAHELLVRGLERVDGLDEDPAVEAAILASLGRSLQRQGDPVRAAAAHRKALNLRRQTFGPSHPEVAESLVDLGEVIAIQQGKEATPLFREAVGILRSEAPRSARLVDAMNYLGMRLTGSPAAEALFREAIAITHHLPDEGPTLRAAVLNNLAAHLDRTGRESESLELLREALELQRNQLGPTHPNLATMESNLATRFHQSGRFEEAAALYRNAIDILERALGERPRGVQARLLANSRTSYGNLLFVTGRFGEAEKQFRESVELTRDLSANDFARLAARANLASLLCEQGHLENAERMYRELIELMISRVGNDHPAVARLESLLAEAVRRQGRLHEAEPLLRQAVDTQRRPGPGSLPLSDTLISLGSVLRDTARGSEAEAVLREGLRHREETLPDDSWQLAIARWELAKLLADDDETTAEAMALLAAALPTLESVLGPDDPRALDARDLLANVSRPETG